MAYQWSQTAGVPVDLGSAAGSNLIITAPMVSAKKIVTLVLSVTDDRGATASDELKLVILESGR